MQFYVAHKISVIKTIYKVFKISQMDAFLKIKWFIWTALFSQIQMIFIINRNAKIIIKLKDKISMKVILKVLMKKNFWRMEILQKVKLFRLEYRFCKIKNKFKCSKILIKITINNNKMAVTLLKFFRMI